METVLFPPCAQVPKGLKGEKGDEGDIGTLNCKCGNSIFKNNHRALTPERCMAAVHTFNVHIKRTTQTNSTGSLQIHGIIENT